MKNMKIKTKDTNRKDSNIDILSEQLASSIGKFMEDKKTEILNIT